MSDDPIDVGRLTAEAQASLPVALPDSKAPLDITIRMLALTIAQKHVGDGVIRTADMYQALKLDNKVTQPISVQQVLHAALVFERYLWGEWSKGIAEKAIDNASREAADYIEAQLRREAEAGGEDQPDPAGSDPSAV